MRWARACVLVVVAAAGCWHDTRDRAADPRRPAERCFADEIGTIDAALEERATCTHDRVACRGACNAGDASSCFELAVALERDPATASDARALFRRGCTNRLAIACTNWAAHGWTGGTDSLSCLYRVFTKTCAADEPFGCGMMGRILVEGRQGLDDRGRTLLQRACDRHAGFPCRVLAYYFEQGRFGAIPREQLDALMTKACDGGDRDACGEHATVDETFRHRP